ncbi:MAG: CRISPR-associated endoribonuclease Cas6 [Nitrososphaeria archaeon]
MRVLFKLENKKEIALPLHYNYYLESAIYRSISPELSEFLHRYGFVFGKRRFKLFTFSRIFGAYKIINDSIKFYGHTSFMVSSPIERFIVELVNGIMKRSEISIGQNALKIESVYFPKPPEFKDKVIAKTLSPITVYSTLLTAQGTKKTYYYSPFEKQFNELISKNAIKKGYFFSKRKIKNGMEIKPLKMREVFLNYKGTIIRGWSGTFILSGPLTLIKVTYDAGLGSKNSEGFGMYEVISAGDLNRGNYFK